LKNKKKYVYFTVLAGLLLVALGFYVWKLRQSDERHFLYLAGILSDGEYTDLSDLFSKDQDELITAGERYIASSEYCYTWKDQMSTFSSEGSIAGIAILLALLAALAFWVFRQIKLENTLLMELDVTQRELEKSLTFSQKLELEKQHLKEFSENIYHQVMSPISAATVSLELEIEKNGNSANLTRARRLLQSSEVTLTALLRLRQFESHVVHLEFDICDLENIISSACEQVYDERGKSFAYQLEFDEAMCPQPANYFWLTECLLTTLRNCAEYSDDSPVLIHTLQNNSGTIITIKNRSKGPNLLSSTDRFSSPVSDKHFGIGLHLANAIIKAHFGTFAISVDGNVVTSEISLPILSGVNVYKV